LTTDRPSSQAEIKNALSAPRASIAPQYFYDARGSELFERITRLPEYYLTRTEAAILSEHADDIEKRLPSPLTLIELGAGNCEKARALCKLLRPSAFVAVDISAEFILDAVAGLRASFPEIDVRAVVGDLNCDIELPSDLPCERRLVFYPGSSIGNFEPTPALALLRRVRGLLPQGGALLGGVDLVKDRGVLEAAYDDAAGVTAQFNLNALLHLNRLIGSDFDPAHWQHVAYFNDEQSRIEMHLEAAVDTTVRWNGGERFFQRGERIHTENSYKYQIEDFSWLLSEAGFKEQLFWTDPNRWFAVFLART
jgi:dimethylhistidine N-methyltransferase